MLSALLFLLMMSQPSYAQAENIDDMSLSDFLNMPTSVASQTTRTARTSPGIVTVITREEIRNMGATDLIDVLYMVPGLDFGHDVQGVVGLAVRGNWAAEGKFSLVIDGQEMNEILYSTAQFGNHYPVEHIKKIEIIRGPGSAIYGGYAELAVIKVTTLTGDDLKGFSVGANYSQMNKAYGRRNISLQWGQKIDDWNLSFATLLGQGRRGEGSYLGYVSNEPAPPDYLYERYDYADAHANNLNPHWYNFGASNKKWDIRLIHDQYITTTRGMFGYTGWDEGARSDFTSTYLGVRYTADLSESLSVTPYLNYRRQNPYMQRNPKVLCCTDLFDLVAERAKVGVSTLYTMPMGIELLGGLEYFEDTARAELRRDDNGENVDFNMSGKQDVKYLGRAAYIQSSLSLDFAELTIGGRWEDLRTPLDTSISSFVPRAALTKNGDDWHVKALASQAYRTPAILNFDLNYNDQSLDIEPETTTTYELEYGRSLLEKSYLTANIFYINIADPIVYQYINDTEFYLNFPNVTTQGLELDYRWKDSWGYANLGYSYYEASDNEVTEYQVEGNDKELLGFPQHKLSLNASVKSGWKSLRINPSLVYFSEKTSYNLDVANMEEIQEKLPSIVLANLYLSYSDAWISGLDLGLGVFNLLDEEHRFVQPYNGELGHVPGPTREWVAKVKYHRGF